MKINTKTLAQFLFNVLGFTKDEIRKLMIDALEQEVRRQTHRAIQQINIDRLASKNVDDILRKLKLEREIVNKVARLVQDKLDISFKEKK